MTCRRDEAGFATVLTLGMISVLAAITMAVGAMGAVIVTRHRAEAAADLAALAVASRAIEGEQAACASGRSVAQAQGARLLSCTVHADLDVVVVVGVMPPGRLAVFGPARGVARAGVRAGSSAWN